MLADSQGFVRRAPKVKNTFFALLLVRLFLSLHHETQQIVVFAQRLWAEEKSPLLGKPLNVELQSDGLHRYAGFDHLDAASGVQASHALLLNSRAGRKVLGEAHCFLCCA